MAFLPFTPGDDAFTDDPGIESIELDEVRAALAAWLGDHDPEPGHKELLERVTTCFEQSRAVMEFWQEEYNLMAGALDDARDEANDDSTLAQAVLDWERGIATAERVIELAREVGGT